jgi:hypothetical protein
MPLKGSTPATDLPGLYQVASVEVVIFRSSERNK